MRIAAAVLLAPVLSLCLWIEVIAGTGMAWGCVQPGQTSLVGAMAWFAFSAFGPGVVVVTTLRSRRRLTGLANRTLRIEKCGFIAGVPLALLGLFIIATSSLI
jgi:hypothetical protein